jgi:perosamine synthetase
MVFSHVAGVVHRRRRQHPFMPSANEPALLPYGRQSIDEDDVRAVAEQLTSPWLTQGPTVGRFEELIAETVGARHAVAVSSGTAALHLACLAAGVSSGDVGLTADVTFVASANAIRYAGGRPRLVDVDENTGLLSLPALESTLAELARRDQRPKVIIPVDLTGAVADLPRVKEVADRVNATVIEDAAHSLGASYEFGGATVKAASNRHSHMAILSFHPVKHVTTGEGGAITTNDEGLYRTLLDLRTHGITKDPARLSRNDGPWYYEQHALGFNYRITDLQCALGVSQLKKLPRFLARRRELAARYDAAFGQTPELVRPLDVPAGITHAYHLYVVRLTPRPQEPTDQLAERRRQLFVALQNEKILPQVHYIPVHRQPDFARNGFSEGTFSGADAYYASCISLPMYPAMTNSDVDRVTSAVLRIVAKGRSA